MGKLIVFLNFYANINFFNNYLSPILATPLYWYTNKIHIKNIICIVWWLFYDVKIFTQVASSSYIINKIFDKTVNTEIQLKL